MNLREQKNRIRKWLNLLRKIKPFLRWVDKYSVVEIIGIVTAALVVLAVIIPTVFSFLGYVIFFIVQIFQFPFTLRFEAVNPFDRGIYTFLSMCEEIWQSALHGYLSYVIYIECFLFWSYYVFKIFYYAVVKKLIEIARRTRKKERELFE